MKSKQNIVIQIESLLKSLVRQIGIGSRLRVVERVIIGCGVFFVCAVAAVYIIRAMNMRELVQRRRHQLFVAYLACYLKGLYCIPEGMRGLVRRW